MAEANLPRRRRRFALACEIAAIEYGFTTNRMLRRGFTISPRCAARFGERHRKFIGSERIGDSYDLPQAMTEHIYRDDVTMITSEYVIAVTFQTNKQKRLK